MYMQTSSVAAADFVSITDVVAMLELLACAGVTPDRVRRPVGRPQPLPELGWPVKLFDDTAEATGDR